MHEERNCEESVLGHRRVLLQLFDTVKPESGG